MIRFDSDYQEGCIEEILIALTRSNYAQTAGYGMDEYCESAKLKISKLTGVDTSGIHFVVGGTQANLLSISSILRPYQGVISTKEGHIATHETGAIEATGHKVLELPSYDGRLSASDIDEYCISHFTSATHEHAVMPKMVYISFSTESGTIYSKKELQDIKKVCFKHNLYLFLDGARLGYGLTSVDCDVTLSDIVELCDIFYIGGTKQGALFGECIVIPNENLREDFRYMIKQKGALLAKGRLLGIQFDTLFTDNLYFDLAKKVNQKAKLIRNGFDKAGFEITSSSSTNQQFVRLTKKQVEILRKDFSFETWVDEGDSEIVRFVTSWATRVEDINLLLAKISEI